MTKNELSQQLNRCKIEYNKSNQKIDDYTNAIKAFQGVKQYFSSRADKYKLKKNSFIMLFAISCPIAVLCSTFSLPLTIILFISSLGIMARAIFYNKVFKKFNYCSNYFTNIVTNLTNRQNDHIKNRNLIMNEILEIDRISSTTNNNDVSYSTSNTEEINYSI